MRLVRVASNLVATYGTLIHGVNPFALSLEPPWNNNEPNISCIPAGVFQCQRGRHRLEGMVADFETFEIIVPGRSKILFHKGNIPANTRGCVLVGEAFNPVLGAPGITESGHGFDEFMGLLRMVNRFALEVIDAFATYQNRATVQEGA